MKKAGFTARLFFWALRPDNLDPGILMRGQRWGKPFFHDVLCFEQASQEVRTRNKNTALLRVRLVLHAATGFSPRVKSLQEIRLRLQESRQPAAHHGMVVNDEDANRCGVHFPSPSSN